jgi:hypothetical protein
MFYCDSCGLDRHWPTETLVRSRGRCELCDNTRLCNDVPSAQLPEPEAHVEKPKAPKPDHYKVVCISLYNEDLEDLDFMVSRLKELGVPKANRSALIRYALRCIDEQKAAGREGLCLELAGPNVRDGGKR